MLLLDENFGEVLDSVYFLLQHVLKFNLVSLSMYPFQVRLDLLNELHLVVHHVGHALTHGSVPLFPLLCLLQSLHPLLLAQVVFQFSRTGICIPKVDVLLLVLLDVGLDVFRNLGHRHELLLDLRGQLIDLVKFGAYLV